jgi:hypothetical protein
MSRRHWGRGTAVLVLAAATARRLHSPEPDPEEGPTVAPSLHRFATLVAAAALAVLAGSSLPMSAASVAKSGYVEFQSPSRNIHCHILRGGGVNEARCDVGTHTFQAPPKPRSCHFDWGFSLELQHHARWGCVSDAPTGSPHVAVLRYGHSRRLGHLRCTSRRTGMVCRNLNTAHGFKLSRSAAVLF